MEDLISVIALILYFVVLSAAKKNKKKKKAEKKASRRRNPDFEQAFEHVMNAFGKEIEIEPEKVSDPKPAYAMADQEGDDPCHEEILSPQQLSMHVKSVSQEEMRAAGEGVDPCHDIFAGDAEINNEDSPVYQSPIFDTEDKDAFARDILRGVIMSEVLSRPNTNGLRTGVKRGA